MNGVADVVIVTAAATAVVIIIIVIGWTGEGIGGGVFGGRWGKTKEVRRRVGDRRRRRGGRGRG